jgi:hypothetical protein
VGTGYTQKDGPGIEEAELGEGAVEALLWLPRLNLRQRLGGVFGLQEAQEAEFFGVGFRRVGGGGLGRLRHSQLAAQRCGAVSAQLCGFADGNSPDLWEFTRVFWGDECLRRKVIDTSALAARHCQNGEQRQSAMHLS